MGPRRLHLSEIATSERKPKARPMKKKYLALLTSITVLPNCKDLVGIFLAVPEEGKPLSEEETCCLLLLDTEVPGTPEKDTDGAHHVIEHSVTVPMEIPAEITPPVFENTGQPLK